MYKTLATVFILNNNHHENKRNQDCYLTNKEGLNYLNLPLIKVCEFITCWPTMAFLQIFHSNTISIISNIQKFIFSILDHC